MVNVLLVALFITVPVLASAADPGPKPSPDAVLGYIVDLPPETEEARAERHRRVAERRASLSILVHRGAHKFAPENTLEAYAAAMDYGADGVEIDPRISRDGVVYLLHDDTLDRTTSCQGKGRDKTYYELLQCSLEAAGVKTRIPTLAAFLELARKRAMLIHIDNKETEVQTEFIRLLTEGDMWDHVVEINGGNADRMVGDPRYELIPYKGWFPGHVTAETAKTDPSVAGFLAQEGGKIFIKSDPTPAVLALDRTAPGKQPLPETLHAWWGPSGILAPAPDDSGNNE